MVDAVVVVIFIDVADHEGNIFLSMEIKFHLSGLFSRERRQRSGSPVGRERRRDGSRSRSPYSRSPVPRR